MINILGWILAIIVIITIYSYVFSKKTLHFEHEKESEKLFLKKLGVVVLSIAVATLLVITLNTLFPSFFIESKTNSINPFVVFKTQSNNLFAILAGIASFLYPYLASIFKIQNNNTFLKILFNSILTYVSIVILNIAGMTVDVMH